MEVRHEPQADLYRVEFTLPAGYKGGAHFHPAHVFVYVVSGEFTIEIAKESDLLQQAV